ncbi:MAG: Trk family potassium uptake protein [Oscillospiraceae bacterium]|nr:Trk family potassium uptake protein [Oscillospiraceae bacterium]
MLPIATQSGKATPFFDALFTSTSAVCVTGLVVQNTATYWSGFGQAVLLLLIQIGGMGVVTAAISIGILSGRKISLMQRSTMQEAIAAHKVGGIVRLTGFIVKMTFLIELIGAAIMAPTFCHDYGWKGIWMAVFHSVSAFCNAGFDLMGIKTEFSSLTPYATNPIINSTIILLIVIGGIGFLTWDDIRTKKWHLRRYQMQSKVILWTSAILIILPAVYFYICDFSHLEPQGRIFGALFQSVTTRTAGFNTADLTAISQPGQFLMIALMLIGGSPGSTAGGMKTTTIAVLFTTALSVFRRKEYANFFGRRLEENVIKNAATIFLMYLFLLFSGSFIICMAEGLPLLSCLFETASAIGTVGLTLGITPSLGILSKGVLILLMFLGRVGGLTLIFATVSATQKNMSKLPEAKITVG